MGTASGVRGCSHSVALLLYVKVLWPGLTILFSYLVTITIIIILLGLMRKQRYSNLYSSLCLYLSLPETTHSLFVHTKNLITIHFSLCLLFGLCNHRRFITIFEMELVKTFEVKYLASDAKLLCTQILISFG